MFVCITLLLSDLVKDEFCRLTAQQRGFHTDSLFFSPHFVWFAFCVASDMSKFAIFAWANHTFNLSSTASFNCANVTASWQLNSFSHHFDRKKLSTSHLFTVLESIFA